MEAPLTCLVCKVCQSKYKCPKCLTPYCSLTCYKSHSVSCSEQFYQEQIEVNLKNLKQSPEEIKEFENALLENYNQSILDLEQVEEIANPSFEEDEEGSVLCERMKQLHLLAEQNSLNLEDLTSEEQGAFFRFLQVHNFEEDFFLSTPWWTLIELPKILKKARKHLCCSENVKASPKLTYTLLFVVLCYIYTFRTYGGWATREEPASTSQEGDNEKRKALLIVNDEESVFDQYAYSLPLLENTDFGVDDIDQFVFEAKARLIRAGCDAKTVFSGLWVDLCKVFAFKERVMEVLEDWRRLYRKVALSNSEWDKEKTLKMIKKLEFLISFCHFHWEDRLCHTLQLLDSWLSRENILKKMDQEEQVQSTEIRLF